MALGATPHPGCNRHQPLEICSKKGNPNLPKPSQNPRLHDGWRGYENLPTKWRPLLAPTCQVSPS